ncbi:alkyl hydroperoxide reductase [Candidatus Pacearchaeota archaeon]|nr:alkyl hydroperoxide reductase [Candidatus Pacearchaeota archaeon]MBD3283486.1 alkyl hydroperoxide reductase [Candidatus Pacearchaeota archaeon]
MKEKKQKIQCEKIFDSIIIGAGPAGITAGIYLARRNLCVLIIYETLGGQTALTADIENYMGFRFISGEDFTKKLDDHLEEYDVTLAEEKVENLKKNKKLFTIETSKNIYKGKTVIIASGARHKKLGVPGEEKFLTKGVAYCATCDAPLFRNKEVAIIGGGNSALESAIQLESYAKKIFILTINKDLEGEDILIEKVRSFKNIEIIPNAITKEIKGEKFVTGIVYEKNKKINEIPLQGVFIEIGYEPNSGIFDVKKNNQKEIVIDNKNQTSEKGIFAAGDVTEVPVKQIIVAAGEGAKAAISAADYLSRFH